MSEAKISTVDPGRARLSRIETALRRPLTLASSLSIVAALLWLPQATMAAVLIEALVTATAAFASPLFLMMAFLLIGILRHGLDAAGGRIAFRAAQNHVASERKALVANLGLGSPINSSLQSSASIATLLGTKLDLIVPWVTRYRLSFAKTAIVPLVILVLVASMSWVAALVLLVAGPLIPLFMALIGLAARDASEKQMAATGSLNGILLEWVNAAADIRILNAGAFTLSQFRRSVDELRSSTMQVLRIAFLSSTVLEFFAALGIALLAVFIGFSLLGTFQFGAYETPLTVGEGVLILLIAPDFFQPLRELAAGWHDKAAALAVAGELAEVEERPSTPILGKGGQPRIQWTGTPIIQTRSLVMDTGHRRIVYPDLVVKPGERLAVTGPSGSGKSTLLALLSGLARPVEGAVLIGDHLLDDETADSWRQRIGFVSQHPHILNGSLKANLTLGDQKPDDHRLQEALLGAQAHDIINKLPGGLNSRLGETGGGVSGGEARRLTIARLLYRNPSVILADEPTADLDSMTADFIVEGLLKAANAGSTLIVATHDSRLIGRLDRSLRLEGDT